MLLAVPDDAARLPRLLSALEDIERWAENSAAKVPDPDDARGLGRVEGFAAVAALVRAQRVDLDVRPPDASERFTGRHDGRPLGVTLERLAHVAERVDVERAAARAGLGTVFEPGEVQAAGRADALDEVADELRAVRYGPC